MFCQTCNQQTETGKFCPNCGSPLSSEESAATSDHLPISDGNTATNPTGQQNEVVEKIQQVASDYGHFFITNAKKPSEAKNADSIISGVITMVLFSLLLTISIYMGINELPFYDPSFVNDFLIPLALFIILFTAVAALTFAGTKLTSNELSFATILAKYSGYLIPFMLLFIIGFILGLLNLPTLPGIIILISFLGPLLMIPTFILFESHHNGFDRIYTLTSIYIVSLLIFGLLLRSFLGPIVESLMGSILGSINF